MAQFIFMMAFVILQLLGANGATELTIDRQRDDDGGPLLAVCTADCDDDDECEAGLECFQRSSGEYDILGCTGNLTALDNAGYGGWDFCYDPNYVDTTSTSAAGSDSGSDSDDDDTDGDTDSGDSGDDSDDDDTDSGDSGDSDDDDTDSGDSDDDDTDTDSGDSDDDDSGDSDSSDTATTAAATTTASATTTSATSTTSQQPFAPNTYCSGLTTSDCSSSHTADGSAVCAMNTLTDSCYAVVSSQGMYGSGNYDEGYTAAEAEMQAGSQKLNAIVGVLAAIVVLLVLTMLGGGYFLYQKSKKIGQIADESMMTVTGMVTADGDDKEDEFMDTTR